MILSCRDFALNEFSNDLRPIDCTSCQRSRGCAGDGRKHYITLEPGPGCGCCSLPEGILWVLVCELVKDALEVVKRVDDAELPVGLDIGEELLEVGTDSLGVHRHVRGITLEFCLDCSQEGIEVAGPLLLEGRDVHPKSSGGLAEYIQRGAVEVIAAAGVPPMGIGEDHRRPGTDVLLCDGLRMTSLSGPAKKLGDFIQELGSTSGACPSFALDLPGLGGVVVAVGPPREKKFVKEFCGVCHDNYSTTRKMPATWSKQVTSE